MSSYGLTDTGKLRKVNQDSFVIVDNEKLFLGVVCDGIGGNNAGEIAADLAAKVMASYFNGGYKAENQVEKMHNAIDVANLAVYKKGNEVDTCKGMGTTLVAAYVDDECTLIANVGDSRAYIVTQENELVQITEDHTLINDLINKHGFNEELARQVVGKNVISRAIGVFEKVEAEVFEIKQDYKTILLCSDGLHGFVDDEEIKEILLSKGTVENKAKKLIKRANDAGGLDNITALIYQR
ncbi:MAG TPA: Stp1/IreP family PP2C-type Ser/Thr phosphatase [Erysipelotrichaceae bacterium]|nr:Stp1/IreP family PP2C-type Ser/Thr phosphatase [Erysipelotrichaceae bacterium]